MARQQKNTSLYSEQLCLLLSTIVQTLRHDSCHWVDTTRQAVLFGQSGESVRCQGRGLLAGRARLRLPSGCSVKRSDGAIFWHQNPIYSVFKREHALESPELRGACCCTPAPWSASTTGVTNTNNIQSLNNQSIDGIGIARVIA